MKTQEVLKNEIKNLEDRIKKLQDEYDNVRHSHQEVELQVAIGQLSRQLSSLKKLLK
jgi:predicted  nucleic acid-binding Zn-ribbon protein